MLDIHGGCDKMVDATISCGTIRLNQIAELRGYREVRDPSHRERL